MIQQNDVQPKVPHFVLAEWVQTWDGHASNLDTVKDEQRDFHTFPRDCTRGVTCHMVESLSQPRCARDAGIPCFVYTRYNPKGKTPGRT